MRKNIKKICDAKRSEMVIFGTVVILLIFVFSFIFPMIYSYGQTDIFYTEKTVLSDYGEACFNEIYRIYSNDESLKASGILNCINEDKSAFNADGKEYLVQKHLEGIYIVTENFEVVGIITNYVINFHDRHHIEGKSIADEYIKLIPTADESYSVYDDYGNKVGELSNCIIRSYDGRDIFSTEQKKELERILHNDGIQNNTVYSETLACELVITREASSVSFAGQEEKTLINAYESPSKFHLLGTDANGMDVFSRIMYGGRISLIVGIVASFAGVFIGTLLGCIAGLRKGKTDMLLMRFVDIFDSLPALPAFLIIGDIMADIVLPAGISVFVMIFVITVFGWSQTAKIIRIKSIEISSGEDYKFADISGMSATRKILLMLLPEIKNQVGALFFMSVGSVILTESSVSFFGLGVRFPYSSWGSMLCDSTTVNELGEHPPIWISTTFMICVTVIGFYLIGEGLSCTKAFADYFNSVKSDGSGRKLAVKGDSDILKIENLTIEFSVNGKNNVVTDGFSMTVKRGEIISLVGASGCGKSVTADVITGLLSQNGFVKNGSVIFNSLNNGKVRSYELLDCNENEFLSLRGRKIGYILQEPCSYFDPLMMVGKQLEESYRVANPLSAKAEAKSAAIDIIERVGFTNAKEIYKLYPGMLSGGMCQRLMAANVLIQKPELIIADEPCSSLDTHSRLIILNIFKDAVSNGASMIFITHDINEAEYLTDNIIFMDGKERFSGDLTMKVINAQSVENNDNYELLKFCGISKSYGKGKTLVQALDNVSFTLKSGSILGIVGAEGSGKTTLAGIVAGIVRPDSGKVMYKDTDITFIKASKRKSICGRIQLVFQHPYNSLFKNMPVGRQIREAVRAAKIVSRNEEYEYVLSLMQECGLDKELYSRTPDTLSGGQCKRVCIARAITSKPDILICDEPLAYLDTDLHMQIIQLLRKLTEKYSMALIFITHNIDMLTIVCDELIVLDKGKIVESGAVCKILRRPQSESAKRMVSQNDLLKKCLKSDRKRV